LWQRWDAKLPNNGFVRRQLAAAKAAIEGGPHFSRQKSPPITQSLF